MAAAKNFAGLFEELRFGDTVAKNRFALAPMTRARAGPKLLPNEIMKKYYEQRSTAGVVITEGTHISPRARGWVDVPGIWTKEQTEAWKPIAKAVHDKGSVAVMQLWHQGRQSHSSFHGGQPPVSASDVPLTTDQHTADYGKKPAETPHPLTAEEIKETIQEFVTAARNAIDAGFDAVEIHGANGYLLDQFLQSGTNKRADDYGGSIENRFRFVGQVLDAVIAEVGAKRVGIRYSPNGIYGEVGSPDFRELFSHVFVETGKRGLLYMHIMDGLAFGFHEHGEPFTLKQVRELVPKDVIIMGNCGHTAESAAKVVEAGDADLVSFGRPYIANPDLPERFANGHPLEEIGHEWWFSPNDEYASGKNYCDFPAFAEKSKQ
eukprot:m.481413 g.481413  ORF g.481413 m.481413 type:complete len:377 (-) comp22164_c0_seq1:156-1286(-)